MSHSDATPPRATFETDLAKGSDSIRPGEWMKPQWAEIPKIRLGKQWINVFWAVPIVFVVLILGVAICDGIYSTSWFQEFLQRYPGVPIAMPAVHDGYPVWLRLQHFLNLFFMAFIIRAGIQILADHPRLYWNRDCTPDTEWFRMQKPVPTGVWTSKDDAVTIPKWLGIPGLRHSIGLARWWHFTVNFLWVINGVVIYVMLFSTDQWLRLVPTTWTVFPNAFSMIISYWSLHFPPDESWTRFNALQQLTYFITVFIAAPLQIFTGLMQSPAISNKFGWLGKPFNRQRARTVHFFGLLWFLFYILVHVTFVFIAGAQANLNHMFGGVNDPTSYRGVWMFSIALTIVVVAWWMATPFTIKHARLIQNVGRVMVGPLKGLAASWNPVVQYSEKEISPHFWPNGTLPQGDEYKELAKGDFADFRLRVDGMVERPMTFSLADLKAMPKQEQVTEHFCIQGWSGVAKWGGVPMTSILDLVRPTKDARYAVFYSFADGTERGRYYDAHNMANMRHDLTIIAYEMNGSTLPLLHGAPLRLRVENELGFKMVKWIAAIEFVADYRHLGSGEGGYNEDHEYYGNRMTI